MTWFALSIISAFFLSCRDLSIKNLKSSGSALSSSMYMLLLAAPFALIYILISGEIELALSNSLLILLSSILDSIAIYLYSYSLRVGDVSKVSSILCFIPVFVLILNFLFFNMVPSAVGMVGVALAIIALLYNSEFSIKSLLKEKSSLLMLGVALCWSSSSLIHRIGAQRLGPFLWASYICVTCSILTTIVFLIISRKNEYTISLKKMPKYALASTSHFMTILCFYGACSIGNIAYVSSLRRLSVIFSSIGGNLFFKEIITKRECVAIVALILSAIIISFS